jgi:methionyl-tRNA formyltransferase
MKGCAANLPLLLSVYSLTMARYVQAFSIGGLRRATTTCHQHPSVATAFQSQRTSIHVYRQQQQQQQQQKQPLWKVSTLLFSSTSDGSSTNADDEKKKIKKRIVFLGTPEVAATSLQAIYEASLRSDAPYEIVGVVTQPPKRRKRKGRVEPSPVGKLSEELGINVLCPEKAKDGDFLDQFQTEMRPDLCVTAAYGQYLPRRFLETPVLGTVNIHPSLLPRWRGASPVQRSLEAGDNPVGVSVLYTVSRMDAGPLIVQSSRQIDENDTATTVLPLLFGIGTKCLLDVLPDICSGKITFDTATPQDEDSDSAAVPVPAAAMIDTSEGEFKVWQESARSCHDRLRGFSMWPQAFMYLQVGDREPMKVKVTETRVVAVVPGDDDTDTETAETAEPTDVVQLGPTKKSGLYVTCFDGSILELVMVQPATRKAFRARDFQNGYPGETIRWVRTPEDQAADPEKYNSRAAKA